MNQLVHVEQKEITIDFKPGRKCKSSVQIRSLMHTMPVAFKLQTTSPQQFCVSPPSGYIAPLSESSIDIILKPQKELPLLFPLSKEKIVLRTALAAPASNKNPEALSKRVPHEWFSSCQNRVFTDAKLKVVYIGATLLCHCVERDDEAAVREMLCRNAQLSTASDDDDDGRTALHLAASLGNLKLMIIMLEHGADINAVNKHGRTPLWEAVFKGEVTVIKELIKRGADTSKVSAWKKGPAVPIHLAATLASTEILQHFIEIGVNLEVKDQEGRTAVHFAVESERMESLRLLLRAGANGNVQQRDGRTPLLIAAEKGLLEAVEYLLEGGAVTNFIPKDEQPASRTPSPKGHVAIMQALKAGELLQAARKGDASAEATMFQRTTNERTWTRDNAGWTPLHIAAFKGYVQVAHRLLLEDAGRTALAATDGEGHTPLHCGAAGGCIEMVELLLTMGANPMAQTLHGVTPADVANARGFDIVANLIQQQASVRLDCYNLELLNPNKGLSHHLQRRSSDPKPKFTTRSYIPRSATPNANLKENLTAPLIRFSTPQKMRQHGGIEETQSPIVNQRHISPERSSKKRHPPLPRQLSFTVPNDTQSMQPLASPQRSVEKHAGDSKPLFSSQMSSIATIRPMPEVFGDTTQASTAIGCVKLDLTPMSQQLSHARQKLAGSKSHSLSSISLITPAMPVAEIPSTATPPFVQHAASSPTIPIKSFAENLSHLVQKPSIPCFKHGQPKEEKKFGIAVAAQAPCMKNTKSSSKDTRQRPFTTNGEEMCRFSLKLQAHLETEKLKTDVNGLPDSVQRVQPNVIKRLVPTQPVSRSHQELLYNNTDKEDLCNSNQNSIQSVSRGKNMHEVSRVQDTKDVTSCTPTVDLKQRCLMAMLSANRQAQEDGKPPSKQTHILTADPRTGPKPSTISTAQQMLTRDGIDKIDCNRQHAGSAAILPLNQASISEADMDAQANPVQAHLSGRFERSPSKSILSSDLLHLMDSNFRKQSTPHEHNISLSSASSYSVTPNQEMNGEKARCILYGRTSAHETEQMQKNHGNNMFLKQKCRQSPSSQNGTCYNPPLRIKQMKKPVSIAVPRNTKNGAAISQEI